MRGKRQRQEDRVWFKGPIELRFYDLDGETVFTLPIEGEPWTIDEGDTFTIDIRNCAIADFGADQHFIIFPVTS